MKRSPSRYVSYLMKCWAVFTHLMQRQRGQKDPNVVLVCGPRLWRWNFTGRLFENHPASPCQHLFRFYTSCRESADLWSVAPRCMCHSLAGRAPFQCGIGTCITSHIRPEEFRFCHTLHIDWRLWHILGSALKGRDSFSFLLFVTHFLSMICGRYRSF